MYKRNILKTLDKSLLEFPAVVLIGVRQCGKTALAKEIRPGWEYFDLERPSDRDLILQDPDLFFKNHPSSLILDEAQLYPELLGALRGVIDAHREQRNRFLITGSSSSDLLKFASETLAGRVAIVELAPLKMNEIAGEPLPPFYTIFANRISTQTSEYLKTLQALRPYETVLQSWLWGGYPEPQSRNKPEFFLQWQENYMRTFVERDLKRLFPGIDSEAYRRFLQTLKDFHANSLNIADIGRALALSESTIRKYLDIADHSFLWRKLPSYERTNLRSIVKNPRGLYRDSGLFHFFSSVLSRTDLESSRYRGASFEAFVIEEILRGCSCVNAYNVKPYFFRTRSGAEVDLVLDGSFGVLPIEIKCSSNTTKQDVPGLIDFVEREKTALGLVINLSEKIQQISDKIFCVPATYI